MDEVRPKLKNKIKPPGRDEPTLNDFNVKPRPGRSMDLPNYDPYDPTPPEDAGHADVPPRPYNRGADVPKAGLGAIVQDLYDKVKTGVAEPPPKSLTDKARDEAQYFRSGQMDVDALKAGGKAIKNGGTAVADKVGDILGFKDGGIVLMHKQGKPDIKFHAGGLHESTGTPEGQKIPQAKRSEAASGKLGPLAQKQERFAENVLHAKDGAVMAKPKEGSAAEEKGESKAVEAKEKAKGIDKAKGGAVVNDQPRGPKPPTDEEKDRMHRQFGERMVPGSQGDDMKESKGGSVMIKGGKGKGKVGIGAKGVGRAPMPMTQQPSANLLSQGFNQTGMY